VKVPPRRVVERSARATDDDALNVRPLKTADQHAIAGPAKEIGRALIDASQYNRRGGKRGVWTDHGPPLLVGGRFRDHRKTARSRHGALIVVAPPGVHVFRSLQAAYRAARSEDTIFAVPGTYRA